MKKTTTKKTTAKKTATKKGAAKKAITKTTAAIKPTSQLSDDEKEYLDLVKKKEQLKKEFQKNRDKMMGLSSYIQTYYKEYNVGGISDEEKKELNLPDNNMVGVFRAQKFDSEEKTQLVTRFYMNSMIIQPMQDMLEKGDEYLDLEFKKTKQFIDRNKKKQRETLRSLVKLEFLMEKHQGENKLVRSHMANLEKEVDSIIYEINKLESQSEPKGKKMIN